MRPERVGSASTASSSRGVSSASSTLPSEVCRAGNRVPICTESPTILGTAARATYTMSEPSSCAIEQDSLVFADSSSRCGRATSHSPCDPTYAAPSSSTRGVRV